MLESFRDKDVAKALINKIKEEAKPDKQYRFMEVCGSHTMAISRFGIRSLMPSNVHLVSGPGCPVCVTPQNEIDAIFKIAADENTVIATFGDMIKVPGSDGQNLGDMRSAGADVRIVFSPLDCIKIASETDKNVVFVGIGFETTAPTIAALAKTAKAQGIKNLFITGFNKTMPEVIGVLLADTKLDIEGFVCPGHVTIVTGLSLYDEIIKSGRAAVVTGFEPVDILSSVLEMVRQTNAGEYKTVNMYGRVVSDEGNPKALALLDEVFDKAGCWWRGIGFIEQSGLVFSEDYEGFDALKKYDIELGDNHDLAGCRCGDVLKGYITPDTCPMFGDGCTPEKPYGPCMVSSEGACSAYYKYQV
jgi:hydrogenase expression/formation protein HypD